MLETILDPTAIALISTIFGGVGLKVFEFFFNKGNRDIQKRRDYREEIAQLVNRLNVLQEEISRYRHRAFDAEEEVALLRRIIIDTGGVLPAEAVEIAKKKDTRDKRNKEEE